MQQVQGQRTPAVRASPIPRSLADAVALRYSVDPDHFWALILCESRGYPDRIGTAGERGPAQFLPATFDWMARLSGLPLTDIDDPVQNVELAAWGVGNGLSGHWTCW